MSTLFLIRHGQASFGAADYDVLSETGGRQARELGVHWANIGQPLDAVYTGPRRRHLDTARHMLDGARSRDVTYPEADELPELDEYPAFKLLRHWTPILEAEDSTFRDIWAGGSAQEPGGNRGGNRRMEQAFHYIIDKWARGELDTGELETFAHFQARVRSGITTIAAREGRGRTIAVVTSGGPICMALQWSLTLADDIAIRQSWVIGNGSVSEFRYRDPSAIALVGFNALDHLRPSALITYR